MKNFVGELSKIYDGANVCLTRSGSASIVTALSAVVPEGSGEVLIPAICCPAVLFATQFAGFVPIVVDVCPVTLNSSKENFAECINKNTVAIIAVHGFGVPCDLSSIVTLARSFDLAVIEDACLTLLPVDLETTPDATVLSFGYDKPISLSGGGGAVITRKTDVANGIIRVLNENSFLSVFQGDAEQGAWRLSQQPEAHAERIRNVRRYIEGLEAPLLTFRPDAAEHPWWRLSGLFEGEREEMLAKAAAAGVLFTKHYRSLGRLMTQVSLSGADKIDANIVNLFVRPGTSDFEIDRNIEFLNKCAQ
jgi:perosamine synthetase